MHDRSITETKMEAATNCQPKPKKTAWFSTANENKVQDRRSFCSNRLDNSCHKFASQRTKAFPLLYALDKTETIDTRASIKVK